MNVKKMSILTLALFSALAATAGGASAGGGKHHFNGKHFHQNFHRHHGVRIVIGGGGGHGGCGFYRDMWHDTGSFKWKRRYYSCKGWW